MGVGWEWVSGLDGASVTPARRHGASLVAPAQCFFSASALTLSLSSRRT